MKLETTEFIVTPVHQSEQYIVTNFWHVHDN